MALTASRFVLGNVCRLYRNDLRACVKGALKKRKFDGHTLDYTLLCPLLNEVVVFLFVYHVNSQWEFDPLNSQWEFDPLNSRWELTYL